jgi:hypothetical protein
VENSDQNEDEREVLKALVARITKRRCVLVLGPGVAIRVNDPDRRPLDELLALDLLAKTPIQAGDTSLSPPSLRHAAGLYFRQKKDRELLEVAVRDFYACESGSTTTFHRDLAHLPFELCVSASPDSLMLTAFKEADKEPQKGYYCFRQANDAPPSRPTGKRPLVYYLFGYYEDPSSLVLTEEDLIDYLVAVVSRTPPIPDQVRSILADPDASFLFLGFGFHYWYLRVLLKVIGTYDHRSRAFAFEAPQLFERPEHVQAVAFFSDDRRRIDFLKLRWESFAHQLRNAYEATLPSPTTEAASAPTPLTPDTPKAFLSYASENRETVKALAEELKTRGIRVWRDEDDLRAGDNWDRKLLDVISRQVDYVVVVQTPAMTTATKGVFHREIAAALKVEEEMGEFEGEKLSFVIPVKIGDCARLSSLKALHEIDVSTADGVNKLVDAIRDDWRKRAALRPRAQGVA